MTRTSQASRSSLLPALLAAVLVTGLGGLVIERRTDRLRSAYRAHRLMEEIGHLEPELRWLQGDRAGLLRSSPLLARAASIGLGVRRGTGAIVAAPRAKPGGVGQ